MAKKKTHDSRKNRAMSYQAIQKGPVRADTGTDRGKLGEVLPIPKPVYKPTKEQDWRKVEPPLRFVGQAAEGCTQRGHRPDGPVVLRRSLRHGRADQHARPSTGWRRTD